MSHIAKHQKVLHQPKSQSSGTTTRNKTKLTLLDVADILEEDNLPNPTVWIEPPAPINGWDTDEDDAQCDNGGLLDNLPRNVLVAGSSVKLANGNEISVFKDEEEEDNELSDKDNFDTLENLKSTVYNDWKSTNLDSSATGLTVVPSKMEIMILTLK